MNTPPGILLVGNGRSLADRSGQGVIIDSFAVVVRFNNFVTAGFEGYVGSKTDWWARAENDDVAPRSEHFSRILLRLQGEDAAMYQMVGERLVPELERQHPRTPIEVIPRSVFTELITEYGFANAPLTGTLVVAHLLKTYPRVHVCGFDNLSGTSETLRHYFSDENVIGEWTTYHEPNKEAAYLSDLIRAGRIVPI